MGMDEILKKGVGVRFEKCGQEKLEGLEGAVVEGSTLKI